MSAELLEDELELELETTELEEAKLELEEIELGLDELMDELLELLAELLELGGVGSAPQPAKTSAMATVTRPRPLPDTHKGLCNMLIMVHPDKVIMTTMKAADSASLPISAPYF